MSRGEQISVFGYGAFGLTVAPCAIMSIVNLATNLVRSEYRPWTSSIAINWILGWLIVGSVSLLRVRISIIRGGAWTYMKTYSRSSTLDSSYRRLGCGWADAESLWDLYVIGLIVEQLTCSHRRQGLERRLGE